MGRKALDITGNTYGSLTALYDTGDRTYGAVWMFSCSCGKEHKVVKSEVTGGKVKSCGCAPNSGRFSKTHGDTGERTYRSWASMVARCANPRESSWVNYGGRGIEVCQEWMGSYAQFKHDMGVRPKGTTLDRMDNEGNYTPDNCRWATATEQANNKRTTVRLTFNGETKRVDEWSRCTGISARIIYSRIQAGWSTKEILTTPRYKHRGTTERYEDGTYANCKSTTAK